MPTLAEADATLFYDEVGAGPPLVLLHGLGSSSADWAPHVMTLREHFRVITIDLRGCGQSVDHRAPHGPFTMRQLAHDVDAVLTHLKATPAHLVGWSLGGMVAFELAAASPSQVASLVIINSGPDWRPKSALQRLAVQLRGSVTAVFGPKPMARVIARKLFPHPEQAPLRAQHIERMGRNDKRTYAALLAAFVGWSIADRLPSLTMPTLAVASDGDYTSVASKEAWVKMMPKGQLLVVPNSRHALPLEDPARLSDIVSTFVGALGPGSAR
jgi:pimeloyl-ACP methyl ester carboxylesterase